MNAMIMQLRFDGKRLVQRNFTYLFFSLVMPAGFYLLFTKIMPVGDIAEMRSFNVSYMSHMIVYSVLISAFFGLAAILKRDRDQGLVTFFRLTAHGVLPYYFSVGFWMVVMSFLSIAMMGGLATGVNGVSLAFGEWLALACIVLIGQIPLMMIGISLSYLPRYEVLSLVSNLITFPMSIVSGLWWPITLLPSWLRTIGEVMPTYFVSRLLDEVTSRAKVDLTDLVGLGVWLILALLLVLALTKYDQRKGVVLGEA